MQRLSTGLFLALMIGTAAPTIQAELTHEALEPILIHEQARDLTDGYLIDLCSNSDPDLRARALTALARIQSVDGLEAAIDALSDAEARVKAKAAFAVGQIGASEAVPDLLDALGRETDVELKKGLVDALGRCGANDQVEFLLDLRDEDPKLAPAAVRALIHMAARGVEVCSDPSRLWRPLVTVQVEETAWLTGILVARAKCRNQAAGVGRALESDNPMVRKAGLRALGSTKRIDATKEISFLIYDDDWHVRWAAVKALSDLGAKREAGLVSLVLDDPNPMVAIATAEAMGGIGPRGLSRLSEYSQTSDWRMRSAYLKTYAQASGDGALVELYENSKNSDWHVRLAVAQTLSNLDSEQGLFILEHMVNDEVPAVAAAAANSLIEYPQLEAANMIRPALRNGDPVVVTVGADGVGQRLNRGALGDLLNAYAPLQSPVDYEPMVAILGAIGQILPATEEQGAIGEFTPEEREQAIALLQRASQDPSPRVSSRAKQSLALVQGEPAVVDQPAPPKVPEEFDLDLAASLELRTEPVIARIVTNRGVIVVELLPKYAPGTVANFVTLARGGYYNGLTFHRVVADFVIQGGDPRGDGWGGPGYEIRCEYNEVPFTTGTVGMATSGKDTAGSQFFITHSPQPHLDGKYTVFGQVTQGQEVVDVILQHDKIEEIVIEGL